MKERTARPDKKRTFGSSGKFRSKILENRIRVQL